jgi:ATP-dependent RNA helicase RhlE
VAETYVHRIGRTGRAGREGRSVIFCEPEDHKYFKAIEKLIAKKIRVE